MKYILCYGDSNTWGCVSEKFTRYDFDQRWPGVMQNALGAGYHVYENALNGRTTVFNDPIEEGRNGRTNFEVTLLQNAPLDAVIIALGINDTKNRFSMQAWDIGWGMDLLISYVKKSAAGKDGKEPKIIIVPPAHIGEDFGLSLHHTVFSDESRRKSKELTDIYKFIAERNGCGFLDTNQHAKAGGDGLHISSQGHSAFGEAMAQKIKELIG